MNYYGAAMKKYATFSGRSRRAEYWAFFGVNFIIAFIIQLLYVTVNSGYEIISIIFNLIVFLPGLALSVRRLHDVGKSGWFILVPIYGAILIAFFDGERGSNRFGEDPKETKSPYTPNITPTWEQGRHDTVPVQNGNNFSKPKALGVFEQGEIIGKEIRIGEESISIGREGGNIIRYTLERSPHISGNHCRLYMRDNNLYVEDYSTNGCYILTQGGEKKHINKRSEILRAGDALYIGSSSTKLAIRTIGV